MSEITLQYTIENDYAYVSGCGTEGDTAIIASSYEGKPVTRIGESVFAAKNNLTNLYIPNTISSIGMNAFYNESSSTTEPSIENLYITSIEQMCTMNIEYSTSRDIQYIKCANPLSWATNVYLNNTLLTELVIPDSVTTINKGTFISAPWLTKVFIPDTVTKIEQAAFWYTYNLAYIELTGTPTLEYNSTYAGWPFLSCGYSSTTFTLRSTCNCAGKISKDCAKQTQTIDLILDGDTITQNLFYNNTKIMTVNIPEGIKTISYYAFCGCTRLENVSIPNTITKIEANAFKNCTKLTYYTDSYFKYLGNSTVNYLVAVAPLDTTLSTYTFAETTKILLYDIFNNHTNLTNLVIPDTVVSIGEDAFNYCTNLVQITLPNTITSIEDSTFFACRKLTNFTLPTAVTEINRDAFAYCDSLTTISLPTTLTYLGYGAFRSCTGLTSISIPDSVTSIGEYAFSNCTSLTSISIGSGLTELDYMAFTNCPSLLKVVIPNNITRLAIQAFSNCTSLETVILPNSPIELASSVFAGCSNLKIVIPESVTSLGSLMFSSGATVYCEVSEVPTTWKTDWNGNNATVYWNCSPSYTKISVTEAGTYTIRIDKKDSKELMFIYLNDTLLTSFSAGMITYWKTIECSSTDTIIIKSRYSVQWTLEDYILGSLDNNTKLAAINFENEHNLIGIENKVFHNCTKLQTINFISLNPEYFLASFDNCTSLVTIKFPNVGSSIKSEAFKNCTALTSVYFTYSIKTIGENAFDDCQNLIQVDYVGSEADWNLITIYSGNEPLLNASITYKDQAFDLIFTVDEANGIATVVGYTGAGSYINIPEVYLYNNKYYPVEVIGESAFENCQHLKTVYIKGSETDDTRSRIHQIKAAAFKNCSDLTSLMIQKKYMTEHWNFLGIDYVGYEAFYNAPIYIYNYDSIKPKYCEESSFAGPKTIYEVDCANSYLVSNAFSSTTAGNPTICEVINYNTSTEENVFTGAQIQTYTINGAYLGMSAGTINNLYFSSDTTDLSDWDPGTVSIGTIYYKGTETAWNKIPGHENITQTVQFSTSAITAGAIQNSSITFYPQTTIEEVKGLDTKISKLNNNITAIETSLTKITEEFKSEDRTVGSANYKYLYKILYDYKCKLKANSTLEDEDGNNIVNTYTKLPTNPETIADISAIEVSQLTTALNAIIKNLKNIGILK